MATKYWVGGTATWDATAGTKWATTSGGVGGAAIPVVGDDVFFNASSGAGTITLSASSTWRSLNCTGFTGTISHPASTTITWGDGTAGAGNVGILFSVGMTYSSAGSNAQLFAQTAPTTPAQTITMNGKSVGNFLVGNAGSGNWQFQDTFTSTGTLTLKSGTLDINSKTVTCGGLNVDGSNVRTLTMGSAAITCTFANTDSLLATTTTNLTVPSNTATMTFSGANANMRIGFFNMNGTSLVFSGGGNMILNRGGGTPTFANLTVNGTAVKTDNISIGVNSAVPIITGNVIFSGQSLTNRLLVYSQTLGTASSMSVAGTTTIANVDFQDVTAAGAGGGWSGSSLGNAGGNSNITFTAAVTRYAVVAGNWSNTATWSATSGGAGGASVPLCHDTVNLDASSGAGSYTADMPRLGKDISWAGFTRTTVLSSTPNTLYGNLTLGSSMTSWSGNQGLTLAGRSSQTITMNGFTLANNSITISAPSGTYTLQDNFTLQAGKNLAFTYGTFDANNKNLSIDGVNINTNMTSVKMGSGNWNITRTAAGSAWNFVGGATSILQCQTSTIKWSGAFTGNQTFVGNGATYNILDATVAGSTGTFIISGANTFNTINFSDTSNARTLQFTAGTTTTVTNFNVNGTTGKLMSVQSATAATHTLSKLTGTVSCDYLSLTNSVATGGASWYAGANSTNVSGNTGWIFSAAQTAQGNFFQFF